MTRVIKDLNPSKTPQAVTAEEKKIVAAYVKTGRVEQPKPKTSPSRTESLEEEGKDAKNSIMQHLALAAVSSGVDLDDENGFKNFYILVKDAVKDKARLRTVLRVWNSSKSRAVVKKTKDAI